MPNFKPQPRNQVSSANQEIYDNLESNVGFVPNIYANYANSDVTLGAILSLSNALKKGGFSAAEIEAISLAVSSENECEYCIAAHTAVGQKSGLSEDQTVAIRQGEINDSKLKAITSLAREITKSHGRPTNESIEWFFSAGYTKSHLVELIALVGLNTANNYLNIIAQTPVDFPAVPELQQA